LQPTSWNVVREVEDETVSVVSGFKNNNVGMKIRKMKDRKKKIIEVEKEIIKAKQFSPSDFVESGQEKKVSIESKKFLKPMDAKSYLTEVKNTDVGFVPSSDLEEENAAKVNHNSVSFVKVSEDIVNLLRGRKVEELIASAWELSNPSDHSGELSVSEGRKYEIQDLVLEDKELENNYPELIDLEQHSISLQSQLLARINEKLLPISIDKNSSNPSSTNCLLPHVVCNTEVLLLIDISSSMTNLSEKKRVAAGILCSVIMSLSVYGVEIQSYAFAERDAIWRLYRKSESFNARAQLLRIVDALRVGNRPGSYPLDAAISAQSGISKIKKILFFVCNIYIFFLFNFFRMGR
jgi:hypothetical protein